jgi:hypothetical protein
MTKTTAGKSSAPKKAASARGRLTPEERKTQRELKKQAQREQDARDDAAFEQVRELTWLRIWSSALRAKMMLQEHVRDCGFDDISDSDICTILRTSIDTQAQSLSRPYYSPSLTLESLDRHNAVAWSEWVEKELQEVLEAIEARRLEQAEAQRLARIRAETIASLTDEQKLALGLLH